MSVKKKILITNDDGVMAPGIKHLWRSLRDHYDVTVVAPSQEQSSVGAGITVRRPLVVEKIRWEDGVDVFHVNGTPVDCVKLACKVVLEAAPDLVVSGINKGSNAGRNVLYSGTVAGAIEGVLQGLPAVAFACVDFQDPNFSGAEAYCKAVVDHIFETPLPQGVLLNVNFPKGYGEGFKGLRLARQGRAYWVEDPEERQHPEGYSYYWLGGRIHDLPEEDDSDVKLLREGFVTAVPIQISQLTDTAELERRRTSFESIGLSSASV